uniref:histidine kinase n=1 Tax=Eiseniibacteriota bacterium TaxID=2212470 RepID=A0A832ICI2_UNCEI
MTTPPGSNDTSAARGPGAALRAFLDTLSAPPGRTLLETLEVGVMVFAPDGAILAANAEAGRLVRVPVEAMPRLNLFDPSFRGIHEDGSPFSFDDYPAAVALRTGRPCRDVTFGLLHPAGELIWLRVHAAPLVFDGGSPEAVVVSMTDLSLVKRMEPRLAETGRMEAIGRLAAGAAHDFNNVLTAITGYTELMLATVSPGDPVRSDLEKVRLASERGAAITRHLLSLARKPAAEPGTIELDAELRRLERHLRRVAGDRVRLALEPGAPGALVRVDPVRLEQMLLNLVTNARDALPGGGEVVLRTSRAPGPAADAGAPADAAWVALSVADNGEGMDEATRARAFEPFFTTRAPGRGSGLGLTTVRALVLECGGAVDLDSAPGRGTTVTLRWPARPAAAAASAGGGERRAHAGTVLLVEGEAQIRELLAAALRAQGFQVIESPDGPSALAAARAWDGPIDLIVTDLRMPGMRGTDLAERLRAERPGMRVLLVTGDLDVAEGEGDVPDEATWPVMPKPFTGAEFVRRVREVLAAPAPA